MKVAKFLPAEVYKICSIVYNHLITIRLLCLNFLYSWKGNIDIACISRDEKPFHSELHGGLFVCLLDSSSMNRMGIFSIVGHFPSTFAYIHCHPYNNFLGLKETQYVYGWVEISTRGLLQLTLLSYS